MDLFWARCEGPIVYGVNDCCMTLADVLAAEGLPDLMAGYRGRYTTRRGFVRAFRAAGHRTLDAAATAVMAGHGRRVQIAQRLDVAIVRHFDRVTQSAVGSPAFFADGFWFLRSDAGGVAIKDPGDLEIYRIV